VFSDDPVKKVAYLSIQANITPVILIRPENVALRGLNGQIKAKEVYITGNLEEPLRIETASFNLAGKVRYKIETVKEGKQYKVRFENIPGVTGSFRGYLRMSTNYPEKPGIRIRVSGSFN
jgi:hypothetical protein